MVREDWDGVHRMLEGVSLWVCVCLAVQEEGGANDGKEWSCIDEPEWGKEEAYGGSLARELGGMVV